MKVPYRSMYENVKVSKCRKLRFVTDFHNLQSVWGLTLFAMSIMLVGNVVNVINNEIFR